jgi:hydroxyethylthiazole kinase-like uncharacterized protein yjeF
MSPSLPAEAGRRAAAEPKPRADTVPATPVAVDERLLATLPLPDHGGTSGKDDRGNVLVVGGTASTPGGVELAGLAALRAGAGRVHLATVASVAPHLAVRFPEARVTGLVETGGEISADGLGVLDDALAATTVVLVGTGAVDPAPVAAIVERVARCCGPATTVVFDAAAIPVLGQLADVRRSVDGRAIAIPNLVEMAILLGVDVDAVHDDPVVALDAAIARHGVPMALRDSQTYVGDPAGRRYVHRAPVEGLGTPGSGDVLAGILAGLCARGADALTALLWAVHAHATAGSLVRGGRLGLLARELLDVVPDALDPCGSSPTDARPLRVP